MRGLAAQARNDALHERAVGRFSPLVGSRQDAGSPFFCRQIKFALQWH